MGMKAEPTPFDTLLATREGLLREFQLGLNENERRSLLSLVAGESDRSLIDIRLF